MFETSCKFTHHAGSSPAQSTNLSDSYQRTEGQTCGTSWTRKFRSSDYRERPINEVWCNGSTIDFGSVSGGSSPPTLTNLFFNMERITSATIFKAFDGAIFESEIK